MPTPGDLDPTAFANAYAQAFRTGRRKLFDEIFEPGGAFVHAGQGGAAAVSAPFSELVDGWSSRPDLSTEVSDVVLRSVTASSAVLELDFVQATRRFHDVLVLGVVGGAWKIVAKVSR